ncbi:hypothetical protein LTR56_018063 [Elasticomyces elasticus]|nr:hypothetical protein LTR56_018063 [Elasticomyces elasticus]
MVAYNASLLDITKESTPDPWLTHANDKFFLTFTGNTRIPMWEASSLMGFYDRFERWPVYMAPLLSPTSERLWAPELHCLQGRWYIYFAGADKLQGNRSHRMYVLGGPPEGQDPHQGPWELLGPIAGWPRRDDHSNGWEDRSERVQELFILRLSDPTTASSDTVMISHPTETWERLDEHGPAIIEGPQWLESPTSHWRGIATLKYLGGDPLDPKEWRKSDKPLLQNREDGVGPYGPGHGCYLHAGGETVALFHATDRDTDGNQNRRCRMQRVRWTPSGPDMGGYVGVQTQDIDTFLQEQPSEHEPGADTRQPTKLKSLLHALTGIVRAAEHEEL